MDNNWNKQLVGKLQKLTCTKDSIEAVSYWCTFYRNKSKAIVETWCREFQNADEDRQISLLYLAHEIILNSMKIKESDGFLDEFWQVLPICLQDIYQKGQFGMEVASKLVDIWEEHEVFKPGHHNQLRAHFLGERPPSSLDDGFSPMLARKRKLEVTFQVGCTAEKLLAAYQAADEDYIDEETIWKAYDSSSKRLKETEKNIHNCCVTGSMDITQSIKLYDELINEETILLECTNQIESNEKTTAALISQLREAIQQEENKLDSIRDQVKDFKNQAENARRIRKNLQNTSDSSHKIYNQTSAAVNRESTKMAAAATSLGHGSGAEEINIVTGNSAA